MKWFQLDAATTEDARLHEIVSRIQGDRRPCDPPLEWSKLVVHGVLLAAWCFTARQDRARPGWCEYSDGRSIPPAAVAAAIMVDVDLFEHVMDAAAAAGHIDPESWAVKLIRFPAMERRADTYRKRVLKREADKVNKGRKKRSSSKSDTVVPKNVRTHDEHNAQSVSVVVAVPVPDLLGMEAPQMGAAVKVWNDTRTPGPKIVGGLNVERQRAIKAALKEHPNLADWKTVIAWMNGERWMNAPGDGTNPTWRADIDHLTKPGNLAKYLERVRLDGQPKDGQVGRDMTRGKIGHRPGKYATALKDAGE